MQDAVGGLSQMRRRINGERSRTQLNARRHDNGCIRQTWHAPLEAGHAVCMAVAAGGRITVAGPGETCTVTILRPAWVRIGVPEATAIRAAAGGYASAAGICVQSVVGGCFATEAPAPDLGPRGAANRGAAPGAGGAGRQLGSGGASNDTGGTRPQRQGCAPPPVPRPGLDGWIADGLRRAAAGGHAATHRPSATEPAA